MKEVFVVCESEEIFSLFSKNLSTLPIHFNLINNIDDAVNQVRSEKPDYIFFAHQTVTKLHNWVARFKSLKSEIPFACFTSKLDWEKRELIWMAGAAEVVELPKLRKEFLKIIETLLVNDTDYSQNKELTGNLSVFSVMDLIQTFEDSNKNGTVEIKQDQRIAELQFNKGQIVNARLGSLNPWQSLFSITGWNQGTFVVKQDRIRHPERFKKENQEIIRECQNYLIKREDAIKKLPDKTQVFYAALNLNYEEINPATRTHILFFKDGNSLENFFIEHPDSSVDFIENMQNWFKKKWLVGKTEFKIQQKKIHDDQNMPLIKKMMKNLFSSKEDKAVKLDFERNNAAIEAHDTDLLNKKDYLFNNSFIIRSFLEKIEQDYEVSN